MPPRLVALIPVGDGSELIKRRPDVRQADRRLAAATAEIGVTTAELYPTIRLVGLYGGAAVQLSQLNTNVGRTWGVGPSISWTFPNMAAPRARVRQAKAEQAAALASFDGVVLTALKETEQALAVYSAALDNRQALGDAQDKVHTAFNYRSRINSVPVRSVIWSCLRRNNRWWRLTPRSLHPMPHSCKTRLRYSKRWEAAGEAKASPFAR